MSEDLNALRSDILTTLAISALLHEDNDMVKKTAKQLLKRAPGSICKSYLRPLAESAHALDIVMEEIVYPTDSKRIGTVSRAGYEYDIYVIWRGDELHYTVDQIVSLTADVFIQRGILDDRIHFNIIHPYYRTMETTSTSLTERSSYAARHRESYHERESVPLEPLPA